MSELEKGKASNREKARKNTLLKNLLLLFRYRTVGASVIASPFAPTHSLFITALNQFSHDGACFCSFAACLTHTHTARLLLVSYLVTLMQMSLRKSRTHIHPVTDNIKTFRWFWRCQSPHLLSSQDAEVNEATFFWRFCIHPHPHIWAVDESCLSAIVSGRKIIVNKLWNQCLRVDSVKTNSKKWPENKRPIPVSRRKIGVWVGKSVCVCMCWQKAIKT